MNKKVCRVLFGSLNITLAGTLAASELPKNSLHPASLEEVIVTAQKHPKSLQDTPLSIAVLNQAELKKRGLYTLQEWFNGAVPSVQASPNASTPSTIVFSIRGNGPSDPGPVTREPSVIPYIDGVPLALPQGLSMEIHDVERVEVLRGPQGTLYGRNATGGALNFHTRRPTGEWGIEQQLSAGRFDALRSVTRVNLPEFNNVSTKLDYVFSERDGWVSNNGGENYNGYKKQGGKITADWQTNERLTLSFATAVTRVESTQSYPQVRTNLAFNIIPEEPDRQSETRFPIPLDPTATDMSMSSLTATWLLNDTITLKSITGYNTLDEGTRSNYGGTLYSQGLVIESEVDHEQLSQEFQLLGSTDSLEWVAGVFYFDDTARETSQSSLTIDLFADPIVLINPPTVFPASTITQDAESKAIYGQLTWSPLASWHFTAGLRHTEERKRGKRAVTPFSIDDRSLDPTFIVAYDISDNISVYSSYKTAFRSGGVHPRSLNMAPYSSETTQTKEIGLKSTLWDRRLRLNLAYFDAKFDDVQIDVFDPDNILINETINGENTVNVNGLEVDLNWIPLPQLQLGLSYTYLDGDMPAQPNSLDNGNLINLEMTQTPTHAGAITIDYEFAETEYGAIAAHVDIRSSDKYAHVATDQPRGGFTLVNARLSLSEISVGKGNFSVAGWVRNVFDEQYTELSFPTTSSIVDVYAEPRTVGVDVTYNL